MSPASPDEGPLDFGPTEAVPPPDRGAAAAPAPRALAAPAAAAGNALPPGTYLGEFELHGVLGEGGFGIVYRAWDHSLKRQVAIKEYLPSSLAWRSGGVEVSVRSPHDWEPFKAGLNSFVREAQMLAQFDHPALVKVYRFWEANGSAYMVMPFYEGRTLRDELRQRREGVDEATLLGWIGPIADALAVIHAEHLYHRDIAPDNVLLLAGSQRPLLLDFGAARRVIGDMTQALTVILKPGYAPVEQYAEIPGMKQGPWTDVYALAGVAHYALRGRTPPPSVGRLVKDSYEPMVGSALEGLYSHNLLAALDHALAVRPENRTASILQLKAELGLPPPPAPAHAGEFQAGRVSEPPLGATPVGAKSDPPDVTDLELPLHVPTERLVQAPQSAKTVYMPPSERRESPLPAPEPTQWQPPPARPSAAAPAKVAAAASPPATGVRGGAGKWIGIGVAAALVAGVGGFMALRSRPEAPPVVAAPPAASAAPVVAASAPVQQPGMPLSFNVAAEFERVVAQQTPGWGLEVKVEPERLRIGKDKLRFTLRSLQEGYITVFSQGADGQLQQLYPNGLTPPPRIGKGGTLKLPQGALEFNTEGPAGPSRMLVLVSRWPRDHKGFAPREEGGFKTFPTGAEAALLAAASTDKLPLIAGRAVCPAGQICTDEFGAATTAYQVVP
jgi:serine/threonine protein kinase